MQRSGRSFHKFILFVLALALALGVHVAGAWGQTTESEDKTSAEPSPEDLPEANTSSSNAGSNSDAGASSPDNAKSSQQGRAGSSAAVRIQAMKGVQILADSSDLKQMIKRMISSQVPVMYQTMMMVENGAATGFMGSMHTVSNLMDNQIQAASLELAVREISPDQGADPLAFVGSMRQGIQQAQGKTYNNAWPVALLHASGDSFDPPDTKTQRLDGFVRNPAGGAGPADMFTNVEDGKVQGPPPGAPPAGGSTASDKKLSDILFNKALTGREDNNSLKGEVLKYLGDVTIETIKAGDKESPAPYAELKFVPATEKGGPSNKLQGFQLREYENKLKIWEQWYKALYAYCDFKSTNPNSNSGGGFPQIFSKKRPSEVITTEMITKGSARDITMSIPTIDLLFKLFVINTNHSDPTKLDCATLQGSAQDTMPDKYEPPQAGGSDDCKGDSAKKCLRNKVLYRLVEMIARSRTLDEFKKWYLELFVRGDSVNNYVQFQVANMTCQALGVPKGVGMDLCDPLLVLDNWAAVNRERWVRHVTELTKLAQFTGGSAVFRGSFNNNSNFSANEGGFDSAGDANPGGAP
jgi:hypothetical protein